MSTVTDTSGGIMGEGQARVLNDLVSLNIYIYILLNIYFIYYFSGKVEVR